MNKENENLNEPQNTALNIADVMLSLPFFEEQKLIDAIEKMMRKRHDAWVKDMMVGKTKEQVGSIPYLSITQSENFIKEMIAQLKKGNGA